MIKLFLVLLTVFNSSLAISSSGEMPDLQLTHHWVGYTAIAIFVLAYVLVILEEQLLLRKSKPVLLAASLIWILIAFVYASNGDHHSAAIAIRHNFLEYAELFFFLFNFFLRQLFFR